jgi:hypothetical protein
MAAPALTAQTTYAELLERCASATFTASFAADGVFTPKSIRGRRYWYFQSSSSEGRTQQYVGPETPELVERVRHHKDARDDERERRALVSTLVRSFGMPRPLRQIGDIVEGLAKAGVFRLRGVLVGTVAYQAYSAILGMRLPNRSVQTGDVDIAQFKNVSVAVEDRTPPMIEVLKGIDKSFRPVPNLHGQTRVTTYRAKGGIRVDFLTPNEGRDTDKPQPLPALQTDAQPLRFLDFLIHEPEPAVVLHNAGIYVNVPSPQRYAIHKLIVAQRRHEGTAKRDKDIQQAQALLDFLAAKRAYELKRVWKEATNRGRTWRELLREGLNRTDAPTREATLKVVGE